MRGSDFIFDSVPLLYYKFHNTNFKRRVSYIDSPDWINNKKPKNEDNKCFQYEETFALNYEEINYKYNWNGIKYLSKTDDWKTFEKNNPTIPLNILYIKQKEIYPAYI